MRAVVDPWRARGCAEGTHSRALERIHGRPWAMAHSGSALVNCWVINMGEPIPQMDGQVRAFRYAMITDALVRAGHSVVRWSSTFRHITKDFRDSAFTRDPENSQLSFRFLHGVGYQWHRSPRRLLHHILEARDFRRKALHEPEPDVIFVSIPTLDMAVESIRYARSRKVPVVIDVSDCWPDHYLTILPSALRPFARPLLAGKYRQLREVLAASAGVTSISRTFLDWAVRRGADLVRFRAVFPIGYDWPASAEARSHPELLAQAGVQPSDFLVLFVGTFTGAYDFEAILRSAESLLHEAPEVKFVFAGSGPREPLLKQAAAKLPNVKLLGWINKPETLAQIVATADVGLCPYRHDTTMSLPNKPFEYMAAGKPVVSSLEGEFREILESNQIGIHYRSDDAAALARAIRALRTSPENSAAMGRRARTLFCERYTPERIYPELVKALEQIARERKAEKPAEVMGASR